MRRAPRSAFCDGERVVFTDVCRRASRPATRCGLDEKQEYCAGQSTGNAELRGSAALLTGWESWGGEGRTRPFFGGPIGSGHGVEGKVAAERRLLVLNSADGHTSPY